PRHRASVHAHLVVRTDTLSDVRGLAVDRDATGEDELLHVASRAESGVGENLVQLRLILAGGLARAAAARLRRIEPDDGTERIDGRRLGIGRRALERDTVGCAARGVGDGGFVGSAAIGRRYVAGAPRRGARTAAGASAAPAAERAARRTRFARLFAKTLGCGIGGRRLGGVGGLAVLGVGRLECDRGVALAGVFVVQADPSLVSVNRSRSGESDSRPEAWRSIASAEGAV